MRWKKVMTSWKKKKKREERRKDQEKESTTAATVAAVLMVVIFHIQLLEIDAKTRLELLVSEITSKG
jgi:hypothetical protein